MQPVKASIIAAFFGAVIAIQALPAVAGADAGCSFNSQLDAGMYRYDVTADSEDACKSQLLRIAVNKDSNPFAKLITPSEAIVEKAWTVDLDDDGKPELLVISHDPADESKKSMDLYAIDGNIVKQVRFPAPTDMTGYRGGDSFQVEGVRIVRAFPLYLPRDAAGTPTGGERRIVYQYRNREILLGLATDAAKQGAIAKKDLKKAAKKSKKSAVVKISGITPKADYIEIQANGPIENYKVRRVDDPWRLIIDIAGAGLGFQEDTITINSLGVSTARIGKHKGFVRIVFDATTAPMPMETITPAENALRIGFYAKPAK